MELGGRALKYGLENGRDNLGEMRLYRLELLARNKNPNTKWHVKRISGLYDLVSGFGSSLISPLLTLGILWLFMGGFYSLWYHISLGDMRQDIFEKSSIMNGLMFSGAVINPLISPGDLAQNAGSFAKELLYGADAQNCPAGDAACPTYVGGGDSIVVVVITYFQYYFSLILYFLFGVAARRYFQMRQ